MVESPSSAEINIQLGDILEFNAPENEKLNQQQFYTKYIDTDKIKLINLDNQELITLKITDGQLDPSIETINLIDRAEFPGYAKQYNLIPGIWIDLYFKTPDDTLFIITGKITNLEEDSISIETYPDGETIYIDFAYKGIPEDLPLEKIIIRKEPTPKTSTTQEQPIDVGLIPISQDEQDISFPEGIPTLDVQAKLQEDLKEGDLIQLGEDLDELIMFVDVPESEKRYSIEKQTDDLLNELLSYIPNYKRTNAVLNNIHTMIERYVQLRTTYSDFDDNGNANLPKHLDENNKPIIQTLINFNKHFEWLLPVSYNRKKLYDLDEMIVSDLDTNAVDPLVLDKILVNETDELDKYYRGDFPSDENKYTYLFKNLNKYFTPFDKPFNEQQSITSQRVNTNILSVIDNLGDLESIVADAPASGRGQLKPSIADKKKFLLETYTTGLSYLRDNHLSPLTPADTITIKSVLTLGTQSLLFSRINLPMTSILDRSELNTSKFAYWKILNNDTEVQEKLTIDTLKTSKSAPDTDTDTESGYMTDQSETDIIDRAKKTFLSGIREYRLDETFINEDMISDSELYSHFLDKVIPNNIELFNNFKYYVPNPLSVYSVIKFLEVFNIYPRDVTYDLNQKINHFVEQNISNYKNNFSINYKEYSKIALKKAPKSTPNQWLQLLSSHKDLYTIVSDAYGLTQEQNYSTTEIFNTITRIDYGKLFTIALRRIDLDLQTTGLINEFITKYEQARLEKQTKPNDCKVISKKYLTLDELNADNDKPINYDPQFDKTNYSFLNKYKSEQDKMSPDEFTKLLETKLVSDSHLTIEAAQREAQALSLGKKPVKNGDYAILSTIDPETQKQKVLYFAREDNKWIEDKDMPSDVVIKDNLLFCNLQQDCITEKDNTCNSLTTAEAQINEDTLKAIYKEFDETYGDKEDDLRARIDLLLGLNIVRIRYLKRLKQAEFLKYNQEKLRLADSLVDDETSVDLIVSPYEKLRDIILGQTDFIKKQYDIQKFVLLLTREPYASEEQYWLYCTKTNVKLLPTFLSHLANAFISGDNYLYKLDTIADKQGEISADGDAYVDKYSGYFIKNIAFDTEEGFTEAGFKLKTREKLEEDLGDAVLEQIDKSQEKDHITDEETRKITNIISAITGPSGMDIDLSNEIDFITRNVLAKYNKIVMTQTQYKARVEKLKREGKKITSYQETIDNPLIILTFAFIIIAIQISIPSKSSRKTFPNCIKSFKGYPIYNDDMSAIKYIACIARKMRSGTPPWNAIQSLKEDKIADKIQQTIKTVLNMPDVQGRIIEKHNYIKEEKQETKLDDTLTDKFYGFFPPLTDFKVKALPLISGFDGLLKSHLKKGDPKQQEQLLTIKSKIIIFGLSIQEKIQKIIDKKTPLITNKAEVPFLQNACCDSTSTYVHEYFVDLDKSIATSNDVVTELSNLLYDINLLSRAPLFFDPNNTKFKYPEIDSHFSQDTIYRAFIVFCKSKELEFNDDIRKICSINSGEPYIEETTEERIARLKEEGINYDEELLQKLLTIINLKNSLDIDLTLKPPNSVELLRASLKKISDSLDRDKIVPTEFTDKFCSLLDRYSFKQEEETSGELRSFKNYLDKQNNILINRIKKFIENNKSIKPLQRKKIFKCLDDINVFLLTGDDIYISPQDETTYKMLYFIRNSIRNIIDVFPNIVLNQVDYSSINIPKHWDLSQIHVMDLKDMANNYYKKLKPFYDVSDLQEVLKAIQIKCKDIEDLAKNTPFFASFNKGDDKVKSVFDERLTELLYKYYILLILDTYISLSKLDPKPTIPIVLSIEETSLETEEAIPGDTEEAVPLESEDPYIETAIFAADKLRIANHVSNYLVTIIDMMCGDKAAINYNKETITSLILTAREREKDEMTEYLKNLSDAERDVDNVFKQYKLGRWSIGLQKGLTQYVKKDYDLERENAEKQKLKEQKMAKQSGMTDLEFDEDAITTQRIEDDVFDLEDYQGEDPEAEFDNDPDEYETY